MAPVGGWPALCGTEFLQVGLAPLAGVTVYCQLLWAETTWCTCRGPGDLSSSSALAGGWTKRFHKQNVGCYPKHSGDHCF
jgi:hypothetical protein